MYKKAIIYLTLLISPTVLSAQTKHTISGTVTDKKNGETLIGATIFVRTTGTGTALTHTDFILSHCLPVSISSYSGPSAIRMTL